MSRRRDAVNPTPARDQPVAEDPPDDHLEKTASKVESSLRNEKLSPVHPEKTLLGTRPNIQGLTMCVLPD